MALAQARTTEPAMADNLTNPVATMKSDGRTRNRHAILPAVQRKSAAAITLALPSGPYSEDLSITNWTPETLLRLLSFVITVRDRKSTRLNSSHLGISYAVFC